MQDFVRAYAAAWNARDGARVMEMLERGEAVSSARDGQLHRGWEWIRAATVERIALSPGVELAVADVRVTPLGSDTALAVASMTLSRAQVGRTLLLNAPGAVTVVVKRTPEGLRLIHEHFSLRVL